MNRGLLDSKPIVLLNSDFPSLLQPSRLPERVAGSTEMSAYQKMHFYTTALLFYKVPCLPSHNIQLISFPPGEICYAEWCLGTLRNLASLCCYGGTGRQQVLTQARASSDGLTGAEDTQGLCRAVVKPSHYYSLNHIHLQCNKLLLTKIINTQTDHFLIIFLQFIICVLNLNGLM